MKKKRTTWRKGKWRVTVGLLLSSPASQGGGGDGATFCIGGRGGYRFKWEEKRNGGDEVRKKMKKKEVVFGVSCVGGAIFEF